ncbi:hypothetical protein [Clostridium tagluense]|uniref:hypothetical protein n=1 Tax=Clostridium tagluense TaxID=360422 RepID=UPI001CF30809|nr:hypothetical protein [Clostridium tagluense]MCB2297809.1 hypothetical protein [Clostridium tagluense]
MATKNIEIQDDTGNIYYPHTSASVVKCSDGNSVESRLANNTQQLATKMEKQIKDDSTTKKYEMGIKSGLLYYREVL